MSPEIATLFDETTNTATYVVADPATKVAAVIDPVLDYDSKAGRTSTAPADRLIQAVQAKGEHAKYLEMIMPPCRRAVIRRGKRALARSWCT
jgi:glyoxylase-like metal-dependent hydrolase (beta-lactamase superfamily II)